MPNSPTPGGPSGANRQSRSYPISGSITLSIGETLSSISLTRARLGDLTTRCPTAPPSLRGGVEILVGDEVASRLGPVASAPRSSAIYHRAGDPFGGEGDSPPPLILED